MLCAYGCQSEANFTLKNGKLCCSQRHTGCPVNRASNSTGVQAAYTSGKRVPSTHVDGFQGWNKGKNLTPNEVVFVEGSTHSTEFVKKRILKENFLQYACSECGISDWHSKPLTLELDHINGVNNDNRLSNLRLLCPNCHSQTPTFRGKGNTGKKKVSDDDLLTAYAETSNIRQTLIKVGLAPKGGNYTRVLKLLSLDK